MNPLETMNQLLAAVERQDRDAVSQIEAGLRAPEWEIRYAAAVAAEDCAAPELAAALTDALAAECARPLYTQNNAPPPDRATRAAWESRGRVKQAIFRALAALGAANRPAFRFMAESALDPREDYGVRVAACAALGAGDAEAARPILEQAVKDPEYCTAHEAARALSRTRRADKISG